MSKEIVKNNQPRKDYVRPELKYYGSLAKLTKTGGATAADEDAHQSKVA